MHPAKAPAGSAIPRLIATSFFLSAALLGLFMLSYFHAKQQASSPSLRSLSPSLSNLVSGAALGSQVADALGPASVLAARTPSRIVRRTFRDEATGAEVLEESAYFEVPEGEGEALADAVRREQEALPTGLDEILLRKARVGRAEAAHIEQPPVDASVEPPPALASVLAPVLTQPPPPQPPAPRPPPAKRGAAAPSTAWAPLDIPTRPASWVAPQRLVPGEREGVPPNSEGLVASLAASLSPPRPLDDYLPHVREELSNRLVVAVALGVHSGKLTVTPPGDVGALAATPIVRVMLDTFMASAQPHHIYRFYFAFDHNDPVYEQAANRDTLTALYAARFADENTRRWHPEGWVAGDEGIDGSTLVGSVHWVHCDFSGKPGWAHSDAVMAAVKEGADYVYRTNDDSKFPEIGDWADRFVAELRARSPVPNIGVTGPTCNEGATW